MSPRIGRYLYFVALALGALPLWVTPALPLTDLPQHLHLISVLHRLNDPTTLYPQVFAARGELTPYLGYYELVSWLSWLLPLKLANALFLSGYVVGLPLSLGFLLRSLGRSRWPSLLALPFAYGDSFAWGFLNYCAAQPVALFACGLFVRTISDKPRRLTWAGLHTVTLLLVFIFHVQVFGLLAFALPFLLLTTRAPEDPPGHPGFTQWRARLLALASVVPGVLAFLVWVAIRMGHPTEIVPGAPWKAWGPMLSPQNLSFKSPEQNLRELPEVLANMLVDRSDRYVLWAVAAVAALGIVLAFSRNESAPPREGKLERWRMPGLALIAFALFMALPFDIRGYMYSMNTRFAHLVAVFAVGSLPRVQSKWRPAFLGLGAATALVLSVPLTLAFSAFSRDDAPLEKIAELAGGRPRVMALIYNAYTPGLTHPVYLHAGAVLAREGGGFTNFSFATTPQSPIKWRDNPPPTFPSEWDPRAFNWDTMSPSYDTFLVRGPSPDRIFGQLLQTELTVTAHEGSFWLVKRR